MDKKRLRRVGKKEFAEAIEASEAAAYQTRLNRVIHGSFAPDERRLAEHFANVPITVNRRGSPQVFQVYPDSVIVTRAANTRAITWGPPMQTATASDAPAAASEQSNDMETSAGASTSLAPPALSAREGWTRLAAYFLPVDVFEPWYGDLHETRGRMKDGGYSTTAVRFETARQIVLLLVNALRLLASALLDRVNRTLNGTTS